MTERVTDDPAALAALAEETARAAGRLVVEGRQGAVEVADTKSSPTDVVTAVDLASEQLIRSRILDARPDDGFVGEEGDDIASSSGVTWVADPIDGTVNFLYDIPQYAVSIAARVEDEVVVGVVHDPVSGETHTAIRGEGAWRDGRPIRVSRCEEVARALVATGFGYQAEDRRRQAAETGLLLPRVRDIRRFGAASLDLAAVGSGRVDAYVERGLKPWDLAAGGLVAEEAGARVAGLGGRPAGELLVVAAPAPLFDAFEALLLECGYAAW
ncbi:MAG: inositol monophosphatase family protein, partial [Nocardioidaceae bacterium]